jgi:hypothetical protein
MRKSWTKSKPASSLARCITSPSTRTAFSRQTFCAILRSGGGQLLQRVVEPARGTWWPDEAAQSTPSGAVRSPRPARCRSSGPHPAGDHDLCRFRADDYIFFICPLTPETQQDQIRAPKRLNFRDDYSISDDLCRTSTTAPTLHAASKSPPWVQAPCRFMPLRWVQDLVGTCGLSYFALESNWFHAVIIRQSIHFFRVLLCYAHHKSITTD